MSAAPMMTESTPNLALLVAEAKMKIRTRDEAHRTLESLEQRLAAAERRQLEINDEITATKPKYEDALVASRAAAQKIGDRIRALRDELTAVVAEISGLERAILPAKATHEKIARDAATVIVRIARIRAEAQAETTRALLRQTAASHAKWHAICAGAARVQSAALDQVSEPLPHRDPGAAMLRGWRDRFDDGLEADLRASGLSGSTWTAGALVIGMSERELLESETTK